MISKKLTHNAPSSGLIKYWIGRAFMAIFGWSVTGQLPPDKKFVLIGAPHTTNWDLPIGLALTYIFRLKVRWMGKHTLFRGVHGFFMRALGGVAVDRTQSHGVVEQMANAFKQADRLVVLIAPSGTRKKMPHWKSGFYHIAFQANVPIVCGYLDYQRKEANLGFSFVPTGNINLDMDRVREYYKNVHAKYPQNTTPVRLAEEGGAELKLPC